MKICVNCGGGPLPDNWECLGCGFAPSYRDGFLEFSKIQEDGHDGFPPGRYESLYKLESGNFWFRSRNKLVTWAINEYFPEIKNFLEVGCGTGFVLSGIADKFPRLGVWASEIDSNGLAFVKKRVPQANLFQMDARKIPFDNEFDVVGVFDVLEHIDQDELVLKQLYKAIRHGGGVLITVPQHPWLWSPLDDFSCHKRRYTRRELVAKLKLAGFSGIRTFSFVSLLVPLMLLSRLSYKSPEKLDPEKEHRLPLPLSMILERVMDFERFFIKFGVSFPFGGSLLCIGFKN